MVKDDRQQTIAAARVKLGNLLEQDKDVDEVLSSFDRWIEDLVDGLLAVYPISTLDSVIEVIARIRSMRSLELKERDCQRILKPDWFQTNDTVGYVAYTDLFAKTLSGIEEHIDYLKNLGITYLHLMPLLAPRPGENDGGYAVMDYRSVRKDLGSMDDLKNLSAKLHENEISLTLDLVLNHVAREHEWAMKAKAGDKKYRDYFYIYEDRKIPDEYERTLPEVFPTFAPGNFTWDDELQGWVWTTFNEWQWDVNWSNPDVFIEYLDIIGFLANQGADCLRLDAIAFIWKQLGTNSQNQPQVHAITQALRNAVRIMAPATIFKAEAIVGPDDVVHYLGQGAHAGKVSDLAYHNSLMVQIWSALAARDGRLLATALSRFAATPTTTAWATYLRCHDDIGWAIDDVDTALVGWNGHSHRDFVARFYANEFPGSFARGIHFQSNPLTGDRRTSGSAASLIGIQAALETNDSGALQTAINRLMCAYAMVFGFGGIPLLYMGDELGLLNDETYLADPQKAADNRWIHRPAMDWKLANSVGSNRRVADLVYEQIRNIIAARKELSALHASTATEVFTTDNPAVLIFRRRHASGNLIQVYNLGESTQLIDTTVLWPLNSGLLTEHISKQQISVTEKLTVEPYAALWLTN